MRTGGFGRSRGGPEQEQVSTLPMIALFVILVTFLVATVTSAAISRFSVDVPTMGSGAEAESEAEEEEYRLVVHVLSDAFLIRDTETEGIRVRIERDERAGSLDALAGVLAELRADRPDHRNVILIPDPEIPYDEVIETADRARAAGLTHVSMASRSPGANALPSAGGDEAGAGDGGAAAGDARSEEP